MQATQSRTTEGRNLLPLCHPHSLLLWHTHHLQQQHQHQQKPNGTTDTRNKV
jgi:hypothetical protein